MDALAVILLLSNLAFIAPCATLVLEFGPRFAWEASQYVVLALSSAAYHLCADDGVAWCPLPLAALQVLYSANLLLLAVSIVGPFIARKPRVALHVAMEVSAIVLCVAARVASMNIAMTCLIGANVFVLLFSLRRSHDGSFPWKVAFGSCVVLMLAMISCVGVGGTSTLGFRASETAIILSMCYLNVRLNRLLPGMLEQYGDTNDTSAEDDEISDAIDARVALANTIASESLQSAGWAKMPKLRLTPSDVAM